MFKWFQSQHVFVKVDSGLTMSLLACDICFRYDSIADDTLATINIVFMILYIVIMKYFMRYENSIGVFVSLFIRFIFICYNIYLAIRLFNLNHLYFTKGFGKEVIIIITSLILISYILQVFTSIKCINNFKKGLRDIINKQRKSNLNTITSEADNSSNEINLENRNNNYL